MEFKGTKGEWIVSQDQKEMVLTDYGAYRPNSMLKYTVAKEELFANAKLIAAAPDLLKKLIESNEIIEKMLENNIGRGRVLGRTYLLKKFEENKKAIEKALN